jgi:hypothetical protein
MNHEPFIILTLKNTYKNKYKFIIVALVVCIIVALVDCIIIAFRLYLVI